MRGNLGQAKEKKGDKGMKGERSGGPRSWWKECRGMTNLLLEGDWTQYWEREN